MPNEEMTVVETNLIGPSGTPVTTISPSQQMDQALGETDVVAPMRDYSDITRPPPVEQEVEETQQAGETETQVDETSEVEEQVAQPTAIEVMFETFEKRMLETIEKKLTRQEEVKPVVEEKPQEVVAFERFLQDEAWRNQQMIDAGYDPTVKKDVTACIAILSGKAQNATDKAERAKEIKALRDDIAGLKTQTVVQPRVASITATYKEVGTAHGLNERQMAALTPTFAGLVKGGMDPKKAAVQTFAPFTTKKPTTQTPTKSVTQTRNGLQLLNNQGKAGVDSNKNVSLLSKLQKIERG